MHRKLAFFREVYREQSTFFISKHIDRSLVLLLKKLDLADRHRKLNIREVQFVPIGVIVMDPFGVRPIRDWM